MDKHNFLMIILSYNPNPQVFVNTLDVDLLIVLEGVESWSVGKTYLPVVYYYNVLSLYLAL